MNLQNYYYYFKSALTPRFCDEIIKRGKLEQEQIALIGGRQINENKKISKKIVNDLKKWRNSNIAWLNDAWIYREIRPYVQQANVAAGWNFDWDWSESCQFTKYSKDQFYDWHSDCFDVPYQSSNKNFNGKIRKLSVTVSLSDPKDYKGGELEFDFKNTGKDIPSIKICDEIKSRGSIVVFPSFVWHKVRPVTKGTRYSLVIWNLGYPFR
jgi:PKHD-type hydroxylase